MPDAHESGYSKADLKKIDSVFSVLEDKAQAYLDKPDLARLSEAALFGQEAHKGQYRDTGEPYFTHPLEVTCLLADMRLDTESLITALLHDTVEDCGVSLHTLSEKFGDNVSQLVDGVTKLTRIELQSIDTKQA
ncbi:MAG: HD domain-containing protein, partial [Alphaproteobacteria bacterium]|nr:HD domain-containing protein [Alphaproteobacteria bacterium]